MSLQKEMYRTVVPLHDELAIGTLLGILNQCGLTKEDLIAMIRKEKGIETTSTVPFAFAFPFHSSLFTLHLSPLTPLSPVRGAMKHGLLGMMIFLKGW